MVWFYPLVNDLWDDDDVYGEDIAKRNSTPILDFVTNGRRRLAFQAKNTRTELDAHSNRTGRDTRLI